MYLRKTRMPHQYHLGGPSPLLSFLGSPHLQLTLAWLAANTERQRLLGFTNICHLFPLEDIGVPISSSEDCVDGRV